MFKKFFIPLTLLFGITAIIQAQIPLQPENDLLKHYKSRFEIKYNNGISNHSSISNTIADLNDQANFILDSVDGITDKELENCNYVIGELKEWQKELDFESADKTISKNENKGLFGYFYKNPSCFFSMHTKNFFIQVDPVINLTVGEDIENDRLIFQNSRGFTISGLLDKKIFFNSSLLETQQSFLGHIEEKINRNQTVPGQGLYKYYNSSVLDGVTGYDFMNAQANIGFNITKSITAQLGHGKFNIGNGIRSLFLSDYAHNYYYLKFNTKVWKFNYQNLFAELSATSHSSLGGDRIVPKKYLASHYLSFNPMKNFEIGLFESVIFHRENHFELQYLNPVIIYRTVEHFIGSPDNVLVGIDFKYNFLKRFSVYGQFMLDEFNFSILKEDRSWWANKYGLQAGLKYIDVFNIDQLDLQLEANIVRPYTYSHTDSLNSFSHFNQALAHPLGANFKELIIKLNYKPFNNFFITANADFIVRGEDKDKISYGSDILKSNSNRPLDSDGKPIDFGYFIGRGKKVNTSQYKLNLSYMIYDNYFIDLDVIYFKDKHIDELKTEELYIGGGLRLNINRNTTDY